jgi:tRNA pseudouridine38-40 synthase
LLEAPQFGMYNDRIGDRRNGINVDRDPIDWDLFKDEMQEFKLKFIYERLRQAELETNV